MTHLPVLSLLFSCAAIVALRPAAPVLGLLDRPGGRKTHDGDVPLIGGIGMFVAIVVGVVWMPAGDPDTPYLMAASAFLLMVGVLDDRLDVPARLRLIAHIATAYVAVAILDNGPRLTFGSAFGPEEVVLTGLTAVGVISVLVGGTINAFNMMDGIDGLAGMMAAIAFVALAWLAARGQDAFALQLSLVTLGAIGGFLLFNLPLGVNRRWRVFMGDAGSTLLGFLISALVLRMSQDRGILAPATALWLVALPLTDLLATMLRRVALGRSPFSPDRRHLHHRLLDAGLSARAALGVLAVLAAALAGAGIGMHLARVPEVVQFYGFLAVASLVAFAASRAPGWVRWLPASWRRLPAVSLPDTLPPRAIEAPVRGANGE